MAKALRGAVKEEGRGFTMMIPSRLPAAADVEERDVTASTFSLGVSADLTSAMPSCLEMRSALASLSPGNAHPLTTLFHVSVQETL